MPTDTWQRVYKMALGAVYPQYVRKAEAKGRTRQEVDEIVRWLTGYSQGALEAEIARGTDMRTFFESAPKPNPARKAITGTICGDRVETIVFFQNVGPALVLAAPAAAVWVPPHLPDLWLFLAIGCLGTIGHLILATAFARVEAARLAPLEYTALIWAVALGYLFFGEVPSPQTLAGGALIVLGALATARR